MYKKLSNGTGCRVKWASTHTPYVDIGNDRYYFTKRDLVMFSDMLNIFIKNYWDNFAPDSIDYKDE